MKLKSAKSRLMASLLVMVFCVAAFFGSTYAWFTDSVTSSSNKIKAGNLEIDLQLKDELGDFHSIKDSEDPVFDYDMWEPGYTDVKFIKVQNMGNLAVKWQAKLVAAQGMSDLAKVIDVYIADGVEGINPSFGRDEALGAFFHRVGTLEEFAGRIENIICGELEPAGDEGVIDGDDRAFYGIALKMQESAGNEYKGMELGAFDIVIEAAQLAFEEDSFDKKYDTDAEY